MKKTFVALLGIIILAAALRLISLTFNPPSLNWDEVSHGYNAYSILKTGKDEWGKSFPLTNFRAYGDYPLPLNLYLTIPFIVVMGPTDLAIRLPHAILGVLTTVAVFFLAWGISKKKSVGVLSAFLAAISPWLFFPSRFVLQSNLSVFFLTAGMAAFFNREKHKFLLPISFLSLGLTLFSYHSTRIFTPLTLVSILIIYRNSLLNFFKEHKVAGWASVFVILIFFLSLPFILANPEARARSNEVFLIDAGAISRIEAARASSKLPPPIARIAYNRPTYFVSAFTKNYINYFLPGFLFFKGGTQFQFSIPNRGLISAVNLPFFYIGGALLVIYALRGKKDYQLLLVWLILAPIPAAITKESFAVLRATTMLPIPIILIALGADFIWKKVPQKVDLIKPVGLSLYFILLAVSFASYLVNYFRTYRTNYSWSWQYGYKEAVNYAKSHYSDYDKIIVTKKYGEPHEYFLFFWPWDPFKYQNDPNLIRFNQSNWYWVDRFDKFYFVNDWQIPKSATQNFVLESKGKVSCISLRCLLITSPDNHPLGWRRVYTINFLDGKSAFELYENR